LSVILQSCHGTLISTLGLAGGGADRVYVTWTETEEDPDSGPFDVIRFRKSEDGGATFSQTLNINLFARYPAIDSYKNRVYIAYEQKQ
jgi:hypothetical protein